VRDDLDLSALLAVVVVPRAAPEASFDAYAATFDKKALA